MVVFAYVDSVLWVFGFSFVLNYVGLVVFHFGLGWILVVSCYG